MKVLLAGNFEWHVPIARNCANALEALGCEVERFDSEDRTSDMMLAVMRIAKSFAKLVGKKKALSHYFSKQIYKYRRQRFLKAIEEFSPDVIFVLRLNHFDVDTMRQLRNKHRTICWMIEPKDANVVRHDCQGYDLYYSMHRSHEPEGAHYLPVFAYDPDNFQPDPLVKKDVPLLFVGVWSPRRQRWIESFADMAQQVVIIGQRWRKKLKPSHPLYDSVKEDWVDVHGLREWYRRAQIVINIDRLDADGATGGNLRIADVPACNTVLLSEYSRDLEEHFNLGEEVIVFRSQQELRANCERLLANPALRDRIAETGLAAVRRIGTYEVRMARVLKDLAELG